MAVEQKLVRKALDGMRATHQLHPCFIKKSQKARSGSGDKRSEETFKWALAADVVRCARGK